MVSSHMSGGARVHEPVAATKVGAARGRVLRSGVECWVPCSRSGWGSRSVARSLGIAGSDATIAQVRGSIEGLVSLGMRPKDSGGRGTGHWHGVGMDGPCPTVVAATPRWGGLQVVGTQSGSSVDTPVAPPLPQPRRRRQCCGGGVGLGDEGATGAGGHGAGALRPTLAAKAVWTALAQTFLSLRFSRRR